MSATIEVMSTWTIPQAFAARRESVSGDAGKQWIESLPATVESLQACWGLSVDGEPMHGEKGLVLPVTRDSEQLVLKVSWQDPSTVGEAAALRIWQGNGAVKLYEHDDERGAMLLERADGKRSLTSIEPDEAARVGGELLRRLAVPAPSGLKTLDDFISRFTDEFEQRWMAMGKPFSRKTLDAALEFPAMRQRLLVNWDLHYDNVLAAAREPWLAVDPMVVVGDLEFGVLPLILRWPSAEGESMLRAFDILVHAAELDERMAHAWLIVRAIHFWLWALETGLTEDPLKCKAILSVFA